MTGNV